MKNLIYKKSYILLAVLISFLLGFSNQDEKPILKTDKPPVNYNTVSQSSIANNEPLPDINPNTTEDFETLTFPPGAWHLEYSGSPYWLRSNASGYGLGNGSAEFDFYQFSSGSQSLVTPAIFGTAIGDSLKFDHAYATYVSEVDILVILASDNNGGTYTTIDTLKGGANVGTGMVTAPPSLSYFVPTSSQWASKSYALPFGTNRIKFTCISAYGNNLYLDNIKIGSSAPGNWTTQAPMLFAKSLGSGAGYSRNDTGWVYVIGGNDSKTLQRYNIRTNTWSMMALVPYFIDRNGSAVLKDSIYSIGGATDFDFVSVNFYLYNVRTNTWHQRAPLPSNRGYCKGAGYQDSLIYVAGGYNNSNVTLSDVTVYNANTNSWRPATPLPVPLFGGGFAVKDDTLIYAGGANSTTIFNTVYRGVINQTDRSIITWTQGASIPSPPGNIFRIDAHSWGDKGIIVTGGSSLTPFSSVSNACLVYSPGRDEWTSTYNKPTSWNSGNSGTAFSNGAMRLVCAGGYDGYDRMTNTEMYTDTSLSITPFEFTLNLTAIIEGHYNSVSDTMNPDSVTVFLKNIFFPYSTIDSSKALLNSSGSGTFKFLKISNDELFYMAVKHRNSIETWTTYMAFHNNAFNFDFTVQQNRAYGLNMIKVDSGPDKFAFYSGDVNQDGFIDLADINLTFNDAGNFATGYLATDLTGDNIIDLSDLTIAFNNSSNFVKVIKPN